MCSHGNVYARVSLVAQIPGFPGNESGCKAGDLGSVPELGRSPGEGNHYPLQYSGLEKSMDRGVWQGFQRVGPWGPLGSQRLGHDWATSLSLSVSMYMFPCYCLHSSHPLLPLLCPQVCSLCLHLYSCPANRFISTISLDSIHMC